MDVLAHHGRMTSQEAGAPEELFAVIQEVEMTGRGHRRKLGGAAKRLSAEPQGPLQGEELDRIYGA
jgi:hypothetical protein